MKLNGIAGAKLLGRHKQLPIKRQCSRSIVRESRPSITMFYIHQKGVLLTALIEIEFCDYTLDKLLLGQTAVPCRHQGFADLLCHRRVAGGPSINRIQKGRRIVRETDKPRLESSQLVAREITYLQQVIRNHKGESVRLRNKIKW